MKPVRDSAPITNSITSEKKIYVLLTIDAADTEEVRAWFNSFCAQHSFETMFIADIKGEPPLEQPIGFAALLKLSVRSLRLSILAIREELEQHGTWKYELMSSEWIEVQGFKRVTDEMKRKVQTDGRISFKNQRYYITQHLRGEVVDLSIDDNRLMIYYNGTLIKTFT